MAKKKTTIDDLAIMIKKGFDNTVSKNDFDEFKSEFYELKGEFHELKDTVNRIEMRVAQKADRFEIKQLEKRVVHLINSRI